MLAQRVPPSAFSTSQSSVTVHLAHRGPVDDGAQAAADQALDFLRAAGLLAARRLAVAAGVGGARQHAVFGGDPALALAAQEAGTRPSTLAVQSTSVPPMRIRQEPSAWWAKPVVKLTRAKGIGGAAGGAHGDCPVMGAVPIT